MAAYEARPMVDGRKTLINGKVEPWTGAVQEVFAPIYKVEAPPPGAPRRARAHARPPLLTRPPGALHKQ